MTLSELVILEAVWLAVCQGWAILHEDIDVCRHADGTQWLLVSIGF